GMNVGGFLPAPLLACQYGCEAIGCRPFFGGAQSLKRILQGADGSVDFLSGRLCRPLIFLFLLPLINALLTLLDQGCALGLCCFVEVVADFCPAMLQLLQACSVKIVVSAFAVTEQQLGQLASALAMQLLLVLLLL